MWDPFPTANSTLLSQRIFLLHIYCALLRGPLFLFAPVRINMWAMPILHALVCAYIHSIPCHLSAIVRIYIYNIHTSTCVHNTHTQQQHIYAMKGVLPGGGAPLVTCEVDFWWIHRINVCALDHDLPRTRPANLTWQWWGGGRDYVDGTSSSTICLSYYIAFRLQLAVRGLTFCVWRIWWWIIYFRYSRVFV